MAKLKSIVFVAGVMLLVLVAAVGYLSIKYLAAILPADSCEDKGFIPFHPIKYCPSRCRTRGPADVDRRMNPTKTAYMVYYRDTIGSGYQWSQQSLTRDMSRRKTHTAFLLTLLVLAAVPLAGCQSGEDFPVYQMETREDYSEILNIDGIQYQRNLSGGWDEQAHYYNDGDQYVWTPAEGIGAQIGVCGKDADNGGGFAVYEIAGDENRTFLYTAPRRFYSGGVETRLWMRDGVTLGTPTAEMVSSITLVFENEDSTSAQVDDPAMIVALLEAYSRDCVQGPIGEGWERGSLLMHHKDFPFLQYAIECRYSPEQEISYCQNADREWLPLPTEWYAVISEHDFHPQGE